LRHSGPYAEDLAGLETSLPFQKSNKRGVTLMNLQAFGSMRDLIRLCLPE
jgi:hypothetical protein